MPDVKYPKNPNSDTVFVEDNGQRTRAIKVAVVDGTIDYPKNANSDSCYVTIDGKKQRALMVADVSGEGTVEYPNNPNSTKGYVEIDGKKQRVVLTASLAGGGTTPTGTIQITSNGITDVTNYASADVQVPTTAPARYVAYEVDVLGRLYPSTTTPVMDFTGVTLIPEYCLTSAYAGSSGVPQNLDLSSIAEIRAYGFYHTFERTLVETVDLSGLKLLGSVQQNALGYCFYRCLQLRSIDFSGLEEISGTTSTQGYMGYMLQNTLVTTLTFNSLHTIGQYALVDIIEGLTGVTMSFPAVTTTTFTHNRALQYACRGATNTTIHFPSNVQSVVEALNGYPSFSGTDTTILFDLPATE